MKVFGDMKCIAVVVVLVTVLVIHPALWGVMHDVHKLGQVVQEWRCTGPHTTLMGKVREFLSTAWWLGPLKVGSSRDPLKECGIPAALGWREVLPLLLDLKALLACLEEEVQKADMEHKEFVLKFLLVACCLLFVPVSGVLLARWIWARFTLARENQSSRVVTKINSHDYDDLVRMADYTLDRCIIAVVYEMMTSDGLIIRKGKYAQFVNDKDTYVPSTLLALLSVEGANAQSPAQEVVTEVRKEVDDKDATSVVRRSLHVPSRFRDRLWGPEKTHLANLRDGYNVEVFIDAKRGKLHIKGRKDNVLESYVAVKDLLAEWRTWAHAEFTRYSSLSSARYSPIKLR